MDPDAAAALIRAELVDDPTIDITTVGRSSGSPRRIEIWMLDVDGRFFITGTSGPRDWLANLRADPTLILHLKQRANIDVAARAIEIVDLPTRTAVLEHPSAEWYRGEEPLERLVAEAPMVEVVVAR